MQNQTRIIIENVSPQLDGGAFFIKRIVGQKVIVTSNVFSDGHDVVACSVKFKHEKDKKWSEVRMVETGNDEWRAEFKVEKQGFYTYLVEGWVDYALNWQHGTQRKIEDNQHVKSELLEGAEFYAEHGAHIFECLPIPILADKLEALKGQIDEGRVKKINATFTEQINMDFEAKFKKVEDNMIAAVKKTMDGMRKYTAKVTLETIEIEKVINDLEKSFQFDPEIVFDDKKYQEFSARMTSFMVFEKNNLQLDYSYLENYANGVLPARLDALNGAFPHFETLAASLGKILDNLNSNLSDRQGNQKPYRRLPGPVEHINLFADKIDAITIIPKRDIVLTGLGQFFAVYVDLKATLEILEGPSILDKAAVLEKFEYVIKKKPAEEKTFDLMLTKPLKIRNNKAYTIKISYLGQGTYTLISGTGGTAKADDRITVQNAVIGSLGSNGTCIEKGAIAYFLLGSSTTKL